MRAYERFLKYVKIWTSSERNPKQIPSSMRQFDLAHQLAFELQRLGLKKIGVDNFCFVYGILPATKGFEKKPKIGFIAHIDTHPDYSGRNVKPQIIENYDKGEVLLGTSGLRLTSSEFPHLEKLGGQTLITTDGTTLLGADDKAGIAEIITALEQIIESGIPHGQISVCFIPDEEIGIGTVNFNLKRFDAQYAYTVDGWEAGEIVCETFHGSQAVFEFKGISTHTGRAKNVLVNAQILAMKLHQMLPQSETPELTEGREGFYHLLRSEGTVEYACLVYNVRDFSYESFKGRLEVLRNAASDFNLRYGQGTVKLTITDQYRNMKEKIEPYWHLIEYAQKAALEAELEPKVCYARGGTDGARLSFMGLPCPNLGIGGYAYHSKLEHITVQSMDAVTRMLVELIRQYAK